MKRAGGLVEIRPTDQFLGGVLSRVVRGNVGRWAGVSGVFPGIPVVFHEFLPRPGSFFVAAWPQELS